MSSILLSTDKPVPGEIYAEIFPIQKTGTQKFRISDLHKDQTKPLEFDAPSSFTGSQLVTTIMNHFGEIEQRKLVVQCGQELLDKQYLVNKTGDRKFSDSQDAIFSWVDPKIRTTKRDKPALRKFLSSLELRQEKVQGQPVGLAISGAALCKAIVDARLEECASNTVAKEIVEWMTCHSLVFGLSGSLKFENDTVFKITEGEKHLPSRPLRKSLIGSSRSITTTNAPPPSLATSLPVLGASGERKEGTQGPSNPPASHGQLKSKRASLNLTSAAPPTGKPSEPSNLFHSLPHATNNLLRDSSEVLRRDPALSRFGIPPRFGESGRKTPSQSAIDNSRVGYFLVASNISLADIAQDLQRHIVIQDRKFNLKTYRNCFLASDAVDYLLSNVKNLKSRPLAVEICETLFKQGYIEHVAQRNNFSDGQFFYRFRESESSQLIISEPIVQANNDPLNLETLHKKMKAEVLVKDRKYHFKVYEKCFVASEAVDWLLKNIPNLKTRSEAVEIGQLLFRAGYIFHTANRTSFSDGELFYRFAEETEPVGISEFLNNAIEQSPNQSLNKREKYAHFLMELEDCDPPKKATTAILGLNKAFKERMESICQKCSVALETHSTVAGLMHERLEQTQILLTPKQILHWERCIMAYAKASSDLRATKLLQYLQDHREDPNNALIGISANLQLTKDLSQNTESNITLEEITSKIHLWASHIEGTIGTLSLPAMDVQEIREFSTILTHGRGFRPGEIALFSTGNFGEYVFVRIKQDMGETVSFYLTPKETELQTDIERKRVFKLPSQLHAILMEGQHLDTLVFDSVEMAWNLIVTKISRLIDDYLVSAQVLPSSKKAEEWRSHKYAITDEPIVKKCVTFLKEIAVKLPPELKEQIKRIDLSDIRQECTETIKYIPRRRQTTEKINYLCEHATSDLVTNSISTFIVICEFILNHIRLERDDILNGIRKNQLAQWWLDLIADRVKDFLETQGYDFTVVPVDYIDNPPRSLDAVRRNLQITKTCLDAYKEYVRPVSHGQVRRSFSVTTIKNSLLQQAMVRLVEGCRQEVYQKLDDFTSRAAEIIYSVLGQRMAISHELLNSPEIPETVVGAIKDILYVQKMKELETQTHAADSKDIVPVIGLVLNNFFRQENELETVLEVWEKKMVKEKEMKEDMMPSLPLSPRLEKSEMRAVATSQPVLFDKKQLNE